MCICESTSCKFRFSWLQLAVTLFYRVITLNSSWNHRTMKCFNQTHLLYSSRNQPQRSGLWRVIAPASRSQLKPVTSLMLGYRIVFQCLDTPDQQETTLCYLTGCLSPQVTFLFPQHPVSFSSFT